MDNYLQSTDLPCHCEPHKGRGNLRDIITPGIPTTSLRTGLGMTMKDTEPSPVLHPSVYLEEEKCLKRINVVYDDEFGDVDILLVPDDIADNIGHVVWEFNQWLSLPKNRNQFVVKTINGYGIISIGTEEFLWWLN